MRKTHIYRQFWAYVFFLQDMFANLKLVAQRQATGLELFRPCREGDESTCGAVCTPLEDQQWKPLVCGGPACLAKVHAIHAMRFHVGPFPWPCACWVAHEVSRQFKCQNVHRHGLRPTWINESNAPFQSVPVD